MNRSASLEPIRQHSQFSLAAPRFESTVRQGLRPVETLLRVVLCLLAASLPNESILGTRDRWSETGNTLPYYVGIVAVALSVFFLPRLYRTAMRSAAWQFIVAAYTSAFIILVILYLTGQIRWIQDYTSLADRWCKDFYMSLLFMAFVHDAKWRRITLLSYLGGWAFFVGAVLFAVATGRASESSQLGIARISVSDMNENVQSMFGASGTVLVVVEALRTKSRGRLVACGVAFVAGLAATSVGSSRTAYASFAAALLFVVIASMRLGPQEKAWLSRGRAIVAICVFLAAGVWLMSKVDFLENATSNIASRFDASFSGHDLGSRDELAAATWDVFLQNPQGIGLGRTLEFLGDYDPHNGYLKVLAEGGVFGFTLFLGAVCVTFNNCRKWLRQSAELGPISCLLFFSVAAGAGQALIELPFWFFFAFLALPPAEAAGSSTSADRRGPKSAVA